MVLWEGKQHGFKVQSTMVDRWVPLRCEAGGREIQKMKQAEGNEWDM